MLVNCLGIVFTVEVVFSFLIFENLCFPFHWIAIVQWCSHILESCVFWSKDSRKQFVFSNLHWKMLSTLPELWKEQGKFSIAANLPELVSSRFFPFLGLLLQRGYLIQGRDATSPSPVCCLVKLMLQIPCLLWRNQAGSWHEDPALRGLRVTLPWLLWMTQGKWGRASSALCAWRTCSLSISCSHIMRKSTPGKTAMSKGKLKVRGKDFLLISFCHWEL